MLASTLTIAHGQILAGGRDLHDIGRPFLGGVEVAGEHQPPDLAERPQMPQEALDLVFDLVSTRGHHGNSVDATHQCQRERAADHRALDCMRGRRRVRQHPLAQADGFIKMTFRHRGDGGQSVDEQPATGSGHPVAQELEHLTGTLGVTHRPLQVGDPGGTPAQQLLLRSSHRGQTG